MTILHNPSAISAASNLGFRRGNLSPEEELALLEQDQKRAQQVEDERNATLVMDSIFEIVKVFDLPVISSYSYFNNSTMTSILEQHNSGGFNLSGLFADTMLTDERINNDLNILTSILMDRWNPENVEFETTIDSAIYIDWFRRNIFNILDRASLKNILYTKFFMGFSPQQICYNKDYAEGDIQLVNWHTSLVQYFQIQRKFAVITQNQGYVFIENNPQWQIFSNSNNINNFYRVWIDCGIAKLADWYLKKRYAMRDWSKYSELYGNPTRKLIVPTNASAPEKAQFLEKLKSLTTNGIIPLLCEEDGKKLWDIEFLQPDKDSATIMSELIATANKSFDIAILGTDGIIENPAPYGSTASLLNGIVGTKPNIECMFLEDNINTMLKNISHVVFGDKKYAPTIRINRLDTEVSYKPKDMSSTDGSKKQ